MRDEYEFRGLLAQNWDLLRVAPADWDDRVFFAEMITRYGGPVLDVGCGTGRLLLYLLEQGCDVDGIDVSPEMLDICEEKADALGVTIDVYEQAMEELDLPREYGTIIVAGAAFQLIVDPGRAQRAMRRFSEHLRPGGVLLMPFVVMGGDDAPAEMPADWVTVREVGRNDGATIRRSSKSRFDRDAHLEHRQDLYEVIVGGTVVAAERHERSPSARGYSHAEVVELFLAAGFPHVELIDPLTSQPAADDALLFVAVGQTG